MLVMLKKLIDLSTLTTTFFRPCTLAADTGIVEKLYLCH